MAAYDLKAPTPGMVQIPAGMNQGSQNLMQFMRMQREQRNRQDALNFEKHKAETTLNFEKRKAEDTLNLETRKANDLNLFRKGQLNLDQQRVDNNLEDLRVDNTLAKDKFTWDQGAPKREVEANRLVNQEGSNAYDSTIESLANGFTIDPTNTAAIESTAEFQAMSPEERTAYWDKVNNGFKGDITTHSGKKRTEEQLRREYANTGYTPEQIDSKVKQRLDSLFPEKPKAGAQVLNSIMKSVGFDRSSGSGRVKAKGLDNAGNIINEQKFVQDWYDRVGVESGTRSWFSPDVGNQDLNDQNISQYTNKMKDLGFNAVQSLAALDVIRDKDTIEVSFDDFMTAPNKLASGEISEDNPSYKAFQKVMASAQSAKNLSNPQEDGPPDGARSALLNFLNQQTQPNGQPTTLLQRREIMMGMLGDKIKAAQANGSGSSGIDEETTALIEEIAATEYGKNTVTPKAVPDPVSDNSPNEFMEMLMGKKASDDSPVIDFLQSNVAEPAGVALKNNASRIMSDVKNNYVEEGLTGVVREAKNSLSPEGFVNTLMQTLGTDKNQSSKEKIADLKYELNRIHPVKGDKKRAEEIKRLIASLSKG